MYTSGSMNDWKARITGAGETCFMADALAVKLVIFGVCDCCSYCDIKSLCTEHKTADINGIKVP